MTPNRSTVPVFIADADRPAADAAPAADAPAVAVDASSLRGVHGGSGIGRYTRNMVRSLAALHARRGRRLVVAVERADDAATIDRIVDAPVSLYPAPQNRSVRDVEDDLLRHGVGAWFNPNPFYDAALFIPERLAFGAVLHDLIPLSHRASYLDVWPEPIRDAYMRRLNVLSANLDWVFFPSQATKNDFDAFVGPRCGRRCLITSEGVDPIFRQTPSPVENARPYLLTVSWIGDRRKNLGFTLLAFRRFVELARNTPFADATLEAVVARDGLVDQARDLCRELDVADRVRFRSDVSDAEMRDLYAGASLLLCLSGAEGFGLPVVEALACGTPVLSSGLSALADFQLKDWIVVADLSSDEAAARSMLRALTAPRRNPGDARRYAAGFDWDETARKTWAALTADVSRSGRRSLP